MPVRSAALALLAAWDGHFVDGGAGSWAAGKNRADAWMLMDAWIKEVLKLTFEELDALPTAKNDLVLFNVLLHGLKPGGINNYYDWFKNADLTAPQTANAIIVKALDNTLATLGASPGAPISGALSSITTLCWERYGKCPSRHVPPTRTPLNTPARVPSRSKACSRWENRETYQRCGRSTRLSMPISLP